MSHTISHTPGEVIRSADVDRSLELVRQSVDLSPVTVARHLSGQITFANLSPELRNYLNSIAVSITTLSKEWTGASGLFNDFPFGCIPIVGSEIVLLNGTQQDYPTDYILQPSMSGSLLHFWTDVEMGDEVKAYYRTTSTVTPIVFMNYTTGHYDIIQLLPTTNDIFVYGTSQSAGNPLSVAKYRVIDMNQMVPPVTVRDEVIVKGAHPNYPPMVMVHGNEMWAAGYYDGGGPVSGGWQNRISRFNISDLDVVAPSGFFEVTTDTDAQITDMVTDNVYVYAFMKEGTYISSNHIAKVRIDPIATVGVINSGLTITGDTNMIISNSGWLYVAYQDPSVYQVRKYDTAPSGGLLEVHQFTSKPSKIIAVDTDVYVLEGYNLQKISDVDDEVENLQTYLFVGQTMEFDGVDLWVSSGDTLYKCDHNGSILQTLVPVSGQTIKEIKYAFGFIWLTYEGNNTVNLSKCFPGLPGI